MVKEKEMTNSRLIDRLAYLYDQRWITQGQGALIAEVSRSEFIDELLHRNISPIQIPEDPVQEMVEDKARQTSTEEQLEKELAESRQEVAELKRKLMQTERYVLQRGPGEEAVADEKNNTDNRKKGMSLAEVMIVVVVLAVAFGAILCFCGDTFTPDCYGTAPPQCNMATIGYDWDDSECGGTESGRVLVPLCISRSFDVRKSRTDKICSPGEVEDKELREKEDEQAEDIRDRSKNPQQPPETASG